MKYKNKKDLIKKLSITVILILVVLTVASKTVSAVKQDLRDKADTLSVNKEIKCGSYSIKLVSITSSPKQLSLLTEYKKQLPDKYEIVLMDSAGNEFQREDEGDSEENFFSTDATSVYKQIEKSKPESVKILEQKLDMHRPDKLKNAQYIPFDSQLPVDVSIGDNKKITVESVNENDGQFEIIFSTVKIPLYTFVYDGGISLYDKTMNKDDRNAYDRVRLEPLGNNEYKITVSDIRETYKNNELVKYHRHMEDSSICIGNYDEMYKEIANVDIN